MLMNAVFIESPTACFSFFGDVASVERFVVHVQHCLLSWLSCVRQRHYNFSKQWLLDIDIERMYGVFV